MEVKLTKTNFDAAARACKNYAGFQSEVCVVAQAVKGLFPNKKVSVGNVTVSVGKPGTKSRKEFTVDETGQKLIIKFDSLVFDDPTNREQKAAEKFRASLPLKFELSERVL